MLSNSKQLCADHKDVLEEAAVEGEHELAGAAIIPDYLADSGQCLHHQILRVRRCLHFPLRSLLVLELAC